MNDIYESLKRHAQHNGSCCHRCTYGHCCSEPVWADECEVKAILGSLTPEQLEQLKPKVKLWMEKALASGCLDVDIHDAKHQKDLGTSYSAEWRAKVGVACPLFQGGKCSVYELRPMSCGVFFAGRINPEDCANVNAKRETIEWSNEVLGRVMMALYARHEPKEIHMEHLGVHLHNLLFGTTHTTASLVRREIEYQDV